MRNQGQWQVAGSAPEVYERELVPAVFGEWSPVLVELAHPRPGKRIWMLRAALGSWHAPLQRVSVRPVQWLASISILAC